jgi:hypothetical protein
MIALIPQQTKGYVFQSFQYPPVSRSNALQDVSHEAVIKYRDALVWRLLSLEQHVDTEDLYLYWDILDTMMNLSVESATELLQNVYGYHIRKLWPAEKLCNYPDRRDEIYQIELPDNQGISKDLSSGALLKEALYAMKEHACHLIRG